MNKYYVMKTNCRVWNVYANNPERAIEMIKTKGYRPVGSLSEEGYCEMLFLETPLEEYKVVKEK